MYYVAGKNASGEDAVAEGETLVEADRRARSAGILNGISMSLEVFVRTFSGKTITIYRKGVVDTLTLRKQG